MTPKEKAQELYNKFYRVPLYVLNVKECCHIAIDEIINQNVSNPTDYGASWTYWKQVKEEIDKLPKDRVDESKLGMSDYMKMGGVTLI